MLRNQHFLAAHIRLEALRDGDGAVLLKMVFKERDEHTRGCDAGVVERVGQIHLAVRTLDADAETAGLCVAEIRAGADLEIFLLARAPRLNVAGFDLQIGLRCLNSFFEYYLPELFPGKLTVYIAAFAGLAALVGWLLLLCGKRAGVTVIFAVSVLPFFKSILIFLTSILALFSAADLGAQALAFAKDFVTFVTAGLPIVLMLFWKGRGY